MNLMSVCMYTVTCHVLLYKKEIIYSIKYRKDFLLAIYTRTHMHTHVHTQAHMHGYTGTHTHTQAHTHAHPHPHAHRHPRMHTHTHTHPPHTHIRACALYCVSMPTQQIRTYVQHSTIDRCTLFSGVPGSTEHTSGVWKWRERDHSLP